MIMLDRLNHSFLIPAMNRSVIFDPPLTIEECGFAGYRFGRAFVGEPRAAFEQALARRVAALNDALATSGLDPDEALGAFEQAAWGAWETAQPGAAADGGLSRQPRSR
jgi:hypothetical protein